MLCDNRKSDNHSDKYYHYHDNKTVIGNINHVLSKSRHIILYGNTFNTTFNMYIDGKPVAGSRLYIPMGMFGVCNY